MYCVCARRDSEQRAEMLFFYHTFENGEVWMDFSCLKIAFERFGSIGSTARKQWNLCTVQKANRNWIEEHLSGLCGIYFEEIDNCALRVFCMWLVSSIQFIREQTKRETFTFHVWHGCQSNLAGQLESEPVKCNLFVPQQPRTHSSTDRFVWNKQFFGRASNSIKHNFSISIRFGVLCVCTHSWH